MRTKGEKNFTLWLLTLIVFFAIAGAFATIMTSFSHNEHMYIAASVLVCHNQVLYKGFAYLQTPYLPLLYGNIYRLLSVSSYYLLIGKLISVLFIIISATALFLIARRALFDIAISLSVVALFFLNITIVCSAKESSNYIMPIALSMASFYMFCVSISKNQIKPFGIALTGFLLAIAIGTKLTYATVVIPFVATSLLYPLMSENRSITVKTRLFYVLLPFVAGIAFGLLPMFYYMLDLDSFIFNNLGFHNVNTQWRQITGFTGRMSLFSKLAYAKEIFFRADNLILLLGILLGLSFSINSFNPLDRPINKYSTEAFLAFLLVLIAVPTALAPTPSFNQYFSMPVSFIFILLVYSCAPKSIEISTLHRRLLLILVLVSVAYTGPDYLRSIHNLTHRDRWSGLHFHDISMNVRNALIDNGIGTDRKIATLSPLFVIESNLPIYSELSTGPFLYRVGDLLTRKQRNQFVGTSPKSIVDLFNEDPPSAILVGFEDELDKPLVEYAKINNYKKVNIAGFGGELYVQP
jgi:hypothetical protein